MLFQEFLPHQTLKKRQVVNDDSGLMCVRSGGYVCQSGCLWLVQGCQEQMQTSRVQQCKTKSEKKRNKWVGEEVREEEGVCGVHSLGYFHTCSHWACFTLKYTHTHTCASIQYTLILSLSYAHMYRMTTSWHGNNTPQHATSVSSQSQSHTSHDVLKL